MKKKATLLLITILLCSCGKEKVILLPEIQKSTINSITDVSAAYLFYNLNQPDSVELNRKNLISTTNWLINVDKRLLLKQIVPHIIFIQNKKQNSSHKNKYAKNYFTCHDISIKNLGFIEFTKTKYILKPYTKLPDSIPYIKFNSLESINVKSVLKNRSNKKKPTHLSWKQFINHYSSFNFISHKDSIKVVFNENISFQNYITFKAFLQKIKKDNILISNSEYISY